MLKQKFLYILAGFGVLILFLFLLSLVGWKKIEVKNDLSDKKIDVSSFWTNYFIINNRYEQKYKRVRIIFTNEKQSGTVLYNGSNKKIIYSANFRVNGDSLEMYVNYGKDYIDEILSNSDRVNTDIYAYLCMSLESGEPNREMCYQKAGNFLKMIKKLPTLLLKVLGSIKIGGPVYAASSCSGSTNFCGTITTDCTCSDSAFSSVCTRTNDPCGIPGFGDTCTCSTTCDTTNNMASCSDLPSESSCTSTTASSYCVGGCNRIPERYCGWSCVPDNNCAATTCIGSTCNDGCNPAVPGALTQTQGTWNGWSACNSCVQTRTCNLGQCGGACVGFASQSCGTSNGNWSVTWGSTNCSSQCGQTESRTCDNQACGGSDCSGIDGGNSTRTCGTVDVGTPNNIACSNLGTINNANANLSWTSGGGLTDYYEYRIDGTSQGSAGNNLGISAAVPAGPHTYSARAVNDTCSSFSSTLSSPWASDCTLCRETQACDLQCGQNIDCSTCGVVDTGAPNAQGITFPNGTSANPTIYNNQTDITLSWPQNTSNLTDSYQVEVYNSSDTRIINQTVNGIANTNLTVTLSSNNIYYWRVKAVNNTCLNLGVSQIYESAWSTDGYFRLNTSPQFVSFTLKNANSVTVAAETVSGNQANQICQTTFDNATPRRAIFEATFSDGDGGSDITSATVRWDLGGGNVRDYNLTLSPAVGNNRTGTVTVDFGAGDNFSSMYLLYGAASDTAGMSSGWVSTDRYLKVWDCNVPLTGNIYDSSNVLTAICNNGTGFTDLAPAGMNFQSMTLHSFVPSADTTLVGNINSYSGNVYWGKQYRLTPNADLNASGTRYQWLDLGVGTTTCNDSTSWVDNALVYPYSTSPALKVNLSAIRNQSPWFQVIGGGVQSQNNINMMTPITCAIDQTGVCIPALSIASTLSAGVGVTDTNGLVSAKNGLNFSSGCTNCLYGQPNDWSYNGSYSTVKSGFNYNFFYNNYFVKLGEGVTLPGGSNMSDIVAGSIGGTGVVLVKGDLNIDVDNTVPVGSFLMIVVSGNVDIDQGVDKVEGMIVSDGVINAVGVGNGLVINGAMHSSSDITFNRDFTTQGKSNLYSGVTVRYRPDFIFSMPFGLSKMITDWRIAK